MAWRFMVRFNKHAWCRGWDHHKVVTGADVSAKRDGMNVRSASDAEEVMVWLKGSEADQERYGTAHNHYRASEPVSCPVIDLQSIQADFPERFSAGSEAACSLFRMSDGRPLTRDMIPEVLETVAMGHRPIGLGPTICGLVERRHCTIFTRTSSR